MAKGYFRRQRYIVRLQNGRGIPASSIKQVAEIAKGRNVEFVETETGDVKLEELLKEANDG